MRIKGPRVLASVPESDIGNKAQLCCGDENREMRLLARREYRKNNRDEINAKRKEQRQLRLVDPEKKARLLEAERARSLAWRQKHTLLDPEEKARRAANRKAERERKRLEFIGPKKPRKQTAEGYRWFYENDESFREKEKRRSVAKKSAVPLYYARQQLGLGKDAPEELVQVKRLHLLIKKALRRIEDEKH